MSLTSKSVFSIGFLGLLCLVLPGSLQAQTVYTYTGNAYNPADCFGVYCSGGPYALSITFDTTLTGSALDNLTVNTVTGGDLTADISSFSFTDGILAINQGNANLSPDFTFFDVSTDNNGNITAWALQGFCYPACGPDQPNDQVIAISHSVPPFGTNDVTDQSAVYACSTTECSIFGAGGGLGANFGPAGTWTSTAAVTITPEPCSLLLFGTGLVGLTVTVGWRRKQIGEARRTDRATC